MWAFVFVFSVSPLQDHGVYAFQWKNFLHTNPPLCVTEKELKEVFGILDNALFITDEAVTKN